MWIYLLHTDGTWAPTWGHKEYALNSLVDPACFFISTFRVYSSILSHSPRNIEFLVYLKIDSGQWSDYCRNCECKEPSFTLRYLPGDWHMMLGVLLPGLGDTVYRYLSSLVDCQIGWNCFHWVIEIIRISSVPFLPWFDFLVFWVTLGKLTKNIQHSCLCITYLYVQTYSKFMGSAVCWLQTDPN